LDRCDKAKWKLHLRPVNVFCKINSFLKRKHTVCRTSEMTHVLSTFLLTPLGGALLEKLMGSP
jgi:hypothetical protein